MPEAADRLEPAVRPGLEPPGWVRIGEFEFDAGSGALRRIGCDGQDAERRLAPQPAALLALLIERRGAVATRDEIRRRLWPDVTVDFDKSLHHCVRKVRAALGEQASDAKYVETIPRRGYRLKCEIHALPEGRPAPLGDRDDSPDAARPRRVVRWIVVVSAVAAALVVWWLARPGATPAADLRIAIMPFADPAMSERTASRATRICERVLAALAERVADRAAVIGPRTTEPLRRRGHALGQIAETVDASFVINANFVGSYDSPEILVEFIRTEDGKHLWVKYYQGLDEQTAIAAEIVDAVTAILAATRSNSG